MPRLFESAAWQTLGHSTLATSMMSSELLLGSAMGPAADDGYAVSYNTHPTRVKFCVTCYRPRNDAARFCGALRRALDFVASLIGVPKEDTAAAMAEAEPDAVPDSNTTSKPIEDRFAAAASASRSLDLGPAEMLQLYGLFKQSKMGDCSAPKPEDGDIKAQMKWEAWNASKGVSKEEAMRAYVALVEKLGAQ